MSVAFTREEDAEAAAADLPDRPISPHPDLVTPQGLAALDAALEQARTSYTAAQAGGQVHADRTAMARATRELRYYGARRASAQVIDRAPAEGDGLVVFGAVVSFERKDGRRQTFRIVGEDEADPARVGLLRLAPGPGAARQAGRRCRGRGGRRGRDHRRRMIAFLSTLPRRM